MPGGFAPEHPAITNGGWAVVWLWIGVLIAAIAVAELTRTVVLRWLQQDRAPEDMRSPYEVL